MVVVSTVLRISDPVVDSVCSIALTTDPFSTKKNVISCHCLLSVMDDRKSR